ncbi:MAG: hypothetical protein QF926_01235 [Alphaproteobacteria bacterium]|jgi:hypothetical protein|nr:hypothetical protein [Alphaproteobacteria bacterium]MDP6515233.1 hypothetical protein [Alphaproteobacteria bacterium]
MTQEGAAFFDPASCTISSVVAEAAGGHRAIIDSERDHDPESGRATTDSMDSVTGFVMARAGDQILGLPASILPSIRINMCASQFPPAAANGISYLKIPLATL